MPLNVLLTPQYLEHQDFRGRHIDNLTIVPFGGNEKLSRNSQVDGLVIFRPRMDHSAHAVVRELQDLGVQVVNARTQKNYMSMGLPVCSFRDQESTIKTLESSFRDLINSYDYRFIDFLSEGYSPQNYYTSHGALSKKVGSLFEGAELSGCRFEGIDFRRVDFSGVDPASMHDIVFVNCDLRGAVFPEVDEYNYFGADFEGCITDNERIAEYGSGVWVPSPNSKLSMKAKSLWFGFDLSGYDVSGSDLSYARFGPSWVSDEVVYASKAQVFQATNMNFRKCNLENTTFEGSVIDGSDFSGAHMKGVDMPFIYNTVRGCNFSNADMQRAHFEGSVFYDCNFAGANLENALFDDRAYDTLKYLLSEDQLRSMHHVSDLERVNEELRHAAEDDDDDDDFYHLLRGGRKIEPLYSRIVDNYEEYRTRRGDD